MNDQMNGHAYNSAFLDRISTSDGMQKTAAYQGGVLRDRVREESFITKILPPQPVTPSECQMSLITDTFVKIEWIEPNSRAMSCTFRGNAPSTVIRGSRFAIPFFKIESQHFEKNEAEILAYPYPITQWIEKNIPLDIQSVFDRYALLHAESAVQLLQWQHNGDAWVALSGTTAAAGTTAQYSVIKSEAVTLAAGEDDIVLALSKDDIESVMQLFPGNEGRGLAGYILLMTETDALEAGKWKMPELGSAIASEVVVDGFKYDTLLGHPYVRTTKTDILRRGNVYAFTKPEFLGYSYILQKLRFFMERIGDRFRFWAWQYNGLGYGNIEAIRKLELYSASVTPTATTGTPALHAPVAEEVIGPINNQADEDKTYAAGYHGTYPHVNQY